MSSDMKVLFLHVPKFSSYYKPLDEFMNITYIPMGVFALADMLTRERISTGILHAGLEWILDREFSVIEYIRARKDLKIVYMPLFWHYQSYDVIRTAEKIKAEFPELKVILGGFTASYFASEVIREFPFIDGVIKGYAEEPVRRLSNFIVKNDRSLPLSFDNFVFQPGFEEELRKAGADTTRTSYFITDQARLDSLRFSNLGLLRNFSHYVRLFSFPLAYSKNLSQFENVRLNNMGLVMFPVEMGRGCTTSCTWCAGNNRNQARMNFESVVLWRSPEKVADTFEEGMAFGYKTFALCFDPEPEKQAYYLDLFEILKKRNIRCGLYFECYSLPTEAFVKSFARTFDLSRSVVAISPESGNEEVRRRNKGFFFSNAAMYSSLDLLAAEGITTDMFFTMGVPFETARTLYDTRDMIANISRNYRNIGRMMTWGIQMEPGSPMFESPESFGVTTDRRTFRDFYRIHSGGHSDTYSALGYSIDGYFLDGRKYTPEEFSEKMMRIKCADFCFLHSDCARYNMPAMGRLTCRLRELKFMIAGFGRERYAKTPRPEFK